MTFWEYVRFKAVTLCFLGIGTVSAAVFMACTGLSGWMILTACVFMLFITLLWLICSFIPEKRWIVKLRRIQEEMEETCLLGEVLPKPVNPVERQYYDMMKAVSRSAIGIAREAVREKDEYCAYVESWIHEIKTPLTACSLIIANDGDLRRIRKELKRADNLTESILYYARLRTAEKDTVIREFEAADVIDEAIKSQMELLISAGIGVETEGSFTVSSDGKSICFMIKQLLINCAKYCPGAKVRITAGDGMISVYDNGPGIPSHELPRVTERGFTGTSGRKHGGSTGMGLYIVKELGKRLGITLSVDSKEGEYTQITLAFECLTKM